MGNLITFVRYQYNPILDNPDFTFREHNEYDLMIFAMQIIKLDVLISTPTKSGTTPGQVEVVTWSSGERLVRALKWGALFFGLSIISIFIPILHFVLVPGLLLASPIVASLIHGQASRVSGGEGTCPACQAPLKIVGNANRWPFSDLCSACQSPLTISQT